MRVWVVLGHLVAFDGVPGIHADQIGLVTLLHLGKRRFFFAALFHVPRFGQNVY